jgi:hypothetical protein
MAYQSPPTVGNEQATTTYANTYIKANLDELESRKDTSFTAFTAGVSITATVEASSTTIVTAGAVSANGSDTYEVEFFSPNTTLPGNASGNQLILSIFDGATQVGRLATFARTDTGTDTRNFPVKASYRLVPTNGSHTYSIRGFRSNADCTVSAGVGGVGTSLPGYIRVRKVQ